MNGLTPRRDLSRRDVTGPQGTVGNLPWWVVGPTARSLTSATWNASNITPRRHSGLLPYSFIALLPLSLVYIGLCFPKTGNKEGRRGKGIYSLLN